MFSAYAWCSAALHMLVYMPLIIGALHFRPAVAYWLARRMARSLLTTLGVRLEIQGLEHLAPGRQYVYICNHSSRLDPFLLAASLPHRAIGIEHDTNFRYPFYGLLISRWGNIPVSHEDHAQALSALQRAAELYRRGTSLVVFPEGQLSPTEAMGPFKTGGFHLAIETEAEVVPTVIRGAFAVSPGQSWLIRPGRVTVHFGEPLVAAHKTLPTLMREVRERMAAARQEPAPSARVTFAADRPLVGAAPPGGPRLTFGVMGTASDDYSQEAAAKTLALGRAIAQRGGVLINGACPGLPALAARGAKQAGGLTVGISPALCREEHVRRYHGPTDDLDVLIYTGSGLMGREVTNIRSSDIVVFVGGRSGTLGEFAIAYDEGRLIGVVEGTGGISASIPAIIRVCKKDSGAHVLYDADPVRLIDRLIDHHRRRVGPQAACPPGPRL